MAIVSEYYNEVYVLEDDPVDNTQVQDTTSSPPRVPLRAQNTRSTTRKKRTILSLFDSEGYAIPDPTVTPPASPLPSKKKVWCNNKRGALTICVVTSVLVGSILGAAFFIVNETSGNNLGKKEIIPL